MDDFEQFYVGTKARVFRTVLAVVGDRAAAEDAVAEAYARALERWRHVAAHPNPAAWVTVTAMNLSRSRWRLLTRERPRGLMDAAELCGEAPADPLGGPYGPDTVARVAAALATLPRRQREVVALRTVGELTAAQVAAELGISAATVHVHLHRGLGTLRERLGVPTVIRTSQKELTQ